MDKLLTRQYRLKGKMEMPIYYTVLTHKPSTADLSLKVKV